MIHLTHIGRMDALGGIERLMQAFMNVPNSEFSHGLFLTGKQIHPDLRPANTSVPIYYSRNMKGWKVPKPFRTAYRNRILRKFPTDVFLFWRYPTSRHDRISYPEHARRIYLEHGSCWDMKVSERKRDFLNRMGVVTCCSKAAQRMLMLRWNCTSPIRIVRNPVPTHAVPLDAKPKTLPENRPLILGSAGRLVSYKATCLTLYTLQQLLSEGIDCRLHIAGVGPLMEPLKKRALQCGIGDKVTFAGETNIKTFFAGIDVFIHPTTRDPFPLVVLEALSHGCPVIATSVDGIPEAVIDMETGFCIQPKLTIDEYVKLTGSEFSGEFPEQVYDPVTDRLREPLAPDPAHLSAAVKRLLGDTSLYTDLSRNAIAAAQQDFAFETFYNNLKNVLTDIA